MAKGMRFPSYDEADLLLREAPILTIKELMGHTRIEMTMRYARLKEEVELLTSSLKIHSDSGTYSMGVILVGLLNFHL